MKKIKALFLVAVMLIVSCASFSESTTIKVDAAQTKTITVGKNKVKILSKSKMTAEYVGTKSKKSSVVIPDTVKVKGKNYKIVKVANNALANNKKVKQITVGANVTTIGKGAFQNCTKLKTIYIQSEKLKKVGKNALKGTSSKLKIEAPSNKKRAYSKLFGGKGNKKVAVKAHVHKWKKVYGTRMEQLYAEDGTTNDYSDPIFGDKWIEGEVHMFDYAITPEMWNAKYGENCHDKLRIYEMHRATNQYVTQTVHDLFPEHYPTVGVLAMLDVYILIDKYNELNGTSWTWADNCYHEGSCEECNMREIYDSVPYNDPQRSEKINALLCERCQAQGKFIRWLVNDCGIPKPAIVQTRSLQVVAGYQDLGHYEIIGYEQLPEIEVEYVKYHKCVCGSKKENNQ